MAKKIKLGTKVRDKITGFEGIAYSRVEYLNGCIQYGVKPKVGDNNKMPDSEYIDESQLEIIEEEKLSSKKTVGGIMKDRPKL